MPSKEAKHSDDKRSCLVQVRLTPPMYKKLIKLAKKERLYTAEKVYEILTDYLVRTEMAPMENR